MRAGIVAHPIAYRWSSFAGLIGQRHDRLLMPHPVLTQLGDPPGPGYARWCGETVDDDELARLRDATNHELAFGNDRFKAQIEAATSRRTSAVARAAAVLRTGEGSSTQDEVLRRRRVARHGCPRPTLAAQRITALTPICGIYLT